MDHDARQEAIAWTAEKVAWRSLIGAVIAEAAKRSTAPEATLAEIRQIAMAGASGAGIDNAWPADVLAIRQKAVAIVDEVLTHLRPGAEPAG